MFGNKAFRACIIDTVEQFRIVGLPHIRNFSTINGISNFRCEWNFAVNKCFNCFKYMYICIFKTVSLELTPYIHSTIVFVLYIFVYLYIYHSRDIFLHVLYMFMLTFLLYIMCIHFHFCHHQPSKNCKPTSC